MQERYDSLNGLRAYSAILIILVHVVQQTNIINSKSNFYKISSQFGWLVFLFMIISAFSMCCGYYNKIKESKISIVEFYSRRYRKILPFFVFLTLLDIIYSHNLRSLYEGFANITLTFGLLPNPVISVIGVGWTLGVIFVFYLLFPFFVFLIKDKKTAIKSFLIALIFNMICNVYFFTPEFVQSNFLARKNIIYCSVFFLAGGIIYLYRDKLAKISSKYKYLFLSLCILLTVIYYNLPNYIMISENLFVIEMIIIFSTYLIYAIGNNKSKFLNNRFTKIISDISMEIYLSHMLIFRIVDKLQLQLIINNNLILFFVIFITTFILTALFSYTFRKYLLPIINKFFFKEQNN